jgi:hypothetical protein
MARRMIGLTATVQTSVLAGENFGSGQTARSAKYIAQRPAFETMAGHSSFV